MKDQDGWKVLKTEVPAGLHLLSGLRADVTVQLLAREVLQEPGNNMGCLFTGTPNVQYRKENGLSLNEIFFGTAYLIGSLFFLAQIREGEVEKYVCWNLKQRLLHTADHLVLNVELESEERLQSSACLPALGFHWVPVCF